MVTNREASVGSAQDKLVYQRLLRYGSNARSAGVGSGTGRAFGLRDGFVALRPARRTLAGGDMALWQQTVDFRTLTRFSLWR